MNKILFLMCFCIIFVQPMFDVQGNYLVWKMTINDKQWKGLSLKCLKIIFE